MTYKSTNSPNKGGKSAAPALLPTTLLLLQLLTTASAQTPNLFTRNITTSSCTHPPPTCSSTYYKVSDESQGLATSCAAVDQAADPVVGLDQIGCQSSCDAMTGCDTINFRWKDPNFNGTSTCYRKQCGDFKVAACTLFSKHKERDVYTKACGAEELWGGHVIGDAFTDLFAGVACPNENETGVAEVLGVCAAGGGVVEGEENCSTTYYKIADEFNGQSSLCPLADSTSEPLLNLDLTACQAQCDSASNCDTVEFRWRNPAYNGQSTCRLRNCGDFDTATCSMTYGQGKDIYTKACGAEENWSKQVITDGNGLFAAVECINQSPVESPQEVSQVPVEEYVPVDCTGYSDEDQPQVCVERYYKISDEFNGLATSCAAVDQSADPVVGLDQAGCQHACDELEGCDTINFRWKDPNFNGTSTCYRKNCGDFKTASCTLFSKHKARDVYTKACGAAQLYDDHVVLDGNGLFAGINCPNENLTEVQSIVETCAANGAIPDSEPTQQSCTKAYYKVSDEFNGLATSCAAVDQAADPVVGLDQAGCQNACDELEGCDTINFRWNDPNFNSTSTCYRKQCGSFEVAACTLFSKHKARDVYTKACGAEELWSSHVLTDGEGLFQGVRCPTEEVSTSVSSGEPVCASFISTNRTNSECDVCSEWTGGSQDIISASVRTCLIWEKTSENGISSCKEYAPSALQLQQQEEYNKYLQERWSEVGVCSGQYTSGTTCEITKEDGTTCQARDQPCHGGTELGGVAGVLSAGWQMTFGTAEDNHVCTMCGRGTYGSCEEACAYRRNFFWSGYNLGSINVEMTSTEVDALLNAFVANQPIETYEIPQPLELVPGVLENLPDDHPLSAENLPTQSIYSIISVDDVLVTVRDQLSLIAVGLKNKNTNITDDMEPHKAEAVLSTSGVKVYETCSCFKCPRGTFQDGLGETKCKSCQEILPGSDTQDTGADGPELCSCLGENDVFLAADGSHCDHCDQVRSGEEHAPPGICECAPDTYEVAGGLAIEPTWVTCTPCPAFSSTLNPAINMFDYGSSIDNCHCIAGTYATEDGCTKCPSGKTSPPDSTSVNDCKLTDSARLMAIVIPTGLVIFAILMCLMYRRFRAKLEKLEAEKRRQIQEKINEATESVNHLAHPIILVTADWFLNAGRMIKHEDARAQSCFITIDTMKELKKFKKLNTLIFLSHQWLAWSEPDPENLQYRAMKSAFEELIRTKELEMNKLYVWLDYTSIPQTHRGLQKLSINSLTNYAGSCDYFVIVAPGKIYHADTGTLCDKYSYQLRSWCRAEQLAHSCRKGVENMFIANDHGLEPLTWDWIKRSLQVFGGELSCCLRGHIGMDQCDREYLVTPALGLYCELLAMEKLDLLTKDKKEVLDFFKTHKHEVFPPTFAYSTPNGHQKRELFGEILTVLDQYELVEGDDGGIMAAAVKSARSASMQDQSHTDRRTSGVSHSSSSDRYGGSFTDRLLGKLSSKAPSNGSGNIKRTEGEFASNGSLYNEFLRFINQTDDGSLTQPADNGTHSIQVETAVVPVVKETPDTDSLSENHDTNGLAPPQAQEESGIIVDSV